MNIPLVTIITPTYNRADYIIYAVDSVLNQTYGNYEMIIIDDGSTDETSEVIKPYLKNDKIKYLYQNNSGQSVARNYGLKNAAGKYICFLDSDNMFMGNKLKEQVNMLESRPDIDIVYSDEEYIDEKGNIISTTNMKRYSGIIYQNLLIDNCVSMNTTMTRRICFDEMGGFDETIKVADDYELWLRFSRKYKFHYEPEYYVKYRVMQDQISSDKSHRFESNRETILHFMEKNPEILSKKQQKYIWCRFYTRRGRHFASQKKIMTALSDYIRACKYDLFCIHPWRSIIALTLFWRN